MKGSTALILALVAIPAQAQVEDPLRSPECEAARERLEQALDEASAQRPGARARLDAVRREAIEACLGSFDRRGVRTGAPEPPVTVAPAGVLPRMEPMLAPAPPLPPLSAPRPAAITTCDPAGCWDSEGRRLNSHGPVLIGPRGACVVQGAVVHCP